MDTTHFQYMLQAAWAMRWVLLFVAVVLGGALWVERWASRPPKPRPEDGLRANYGEPVVVPLDEGGSMVVYGWKKVEQ